MRIVPRSIERPRNAPTQTPPEKQQTTACQCEPPPLRSTALALHSRLDRAARRWPLPSQTGHVTDEKRSESADLPAAELPVPAGTDGRFPRRRACGHSRGRRRSPDRHRSIVARADRRAAVPLRPGVDAHLRARQAAQRGVCARRPRGAVSSSELERLFRNRFLPRIDIRPCSECNRLRASTNSNRLPSFSDASDYLPSARNTARDSIPLVVRETTARECCAASLGTKRGNPRAFGNPR